MAEILVVQSKVKSVIKKAGCNTSAEAISAISKGVEDLLKKAVSRAKANRRKTVKAGDV